MKLNYFVIPFATLITATIGSFLTSGGMVWYQMILTPTWTPSGMAIGIVWTVLFALATLSALIVWNHEDHHAKERRWGIGGLFIANAVLSVLWSLAFFTLHLLGAATLEAGLLGVSILLLAIVIWPHSRFASVLLWPYLVWVCFATTLTGIIWRMNV